MHSWAGLGPGWPESLGPCLMTHTPSEDCHLPEARHVRAGFQLDNFELCTLMSLSSRTGPEIAATPHRCYNICPRMTLLMNSHTQGSTTQLCLNGNKHKSHAGVHASHTPYGVKAIFIHCKPDTLYMYSMNVLCCYVCGCTIADVRVHTTVPVVHLTVQ